MQPPPAVLARQRQRRLSVRGGASVSPFQEIDALCVLDFFVSEELQRCGIGRALFDAMLQSHDADPSQVALDRPTAKSIAFMRRHYGVGEPFEHANRFVTFGDTLWAREGRYS